jgi:hypothetical protein
MTTFLCRAAAVFLALLAVACSQSQPQSEADLNDPRATEEIRRIVQGSSAEIIERDLARLLRQVIERNGSPGTELTSAGFQPAPALPERYGYTRADGVGVGVSIENKRVEVRVTRQETK